MTIPVRVLETSQRLDTYETLAERLGVSRATLERAVSRGQLAHIRIGRCVRFNERQVEAYLRRHERRASG